MKTLLLRLNVYIFVFAFPENCLLQEGLLVARNCTVIRKLYMQQFLETIGVIKSEKTAEFKMAPAILMLILMLAFMGTTVYMLVSSL